MRELMVTRPCDATISLVLNACFKIRLSKREELQSRLFASIAIQHRNMQVFNGCINRVFAYCIDNCMRKKKNEVESLTLFFFFFYTWINL